VQANSGTDVARRICEILNLGNSAAPGIADTAQSVTPVAVQLVKYALRPLSGAGWPALEAPRCPVIACLALPCVLVMLSPHQHAGLIAGISLPDHDVAVCHLADTAVCQLLLRYADAQYAGD
jgi:hypothetical protein